MDAIEVDGKSTPLAGTPNLLSRIAIIPGFVALQSPGYIQVTGTTDTKEEHMTETPERPSITPDSMTMDEEFDKWRARWFEYHRLAVDQILSTLDESREVEALAAALEALRERFDQGAEKSLDYFEARWWTTEAGELKLRSTHSKDQTKTVFWHEEREHWVVKRSGTESNEDIARALVRECLQWGDLHHVGLAKSLLSEGFVPPDGSD